MKRKRTLFAAALMLLPSIGHTQGKKPEPLPHRRALLVAVTGYADEKKHKKADSVQELDTLPDVEAVAQVLISRFGFKKEDIVILKTPEQTTHQSILANFRKVLIEPTQPGDIVFFHYSGHGSEVADAKDVTGKDQTLVPSDYTSRRDGKNDIRDKEIAALLGELKAKQPGSAILTFDSCHSGDVTRGRMLVRGFERPLDLPNKPSGDEAPPTHTAAAGAAAGFIVISACLSTQLDSQVTLDAGDKPLFRGEEPGEMGSLSYALCKALAEATKQTTYRDIFERVTSLLHEKGLTQQPQMEGQLDRALFDNKLILPETTLRVDLDADNNPLLQAGSLMGITVDSKISIFPAGTKKTKDAQPIATATITDVHAMESEMDCKLAPGVKIAALRLAPAIITEQVYPAGSALRLDLSGLKSHPRRQEILDALQDLIKKNAIDAKETGYEKNYDLRVVPPQTARDSGVPADKIRGDASAADSLVIERPEISLLAVNLSHSNKPRYADVFPNDEDLPGRIRETVLHWIKWRAINGIVKPPTSDYSSVEAIIIPCEVDTTREHKWLRDKPPAPASGGIPRLRVGDYFRVEIKNNNPVPVYASLLDLQSDGVINAAWPAVGDSTNNFIPGETRFPVRSTTGSYLTFVVTEPAGLETLKVIATEKPSNFSILDDNKTAERGIKRGTATPLQQLLFDAVDGTRGVLASQEIGGWGVSDFHFTILPAAPAP